MTGDVEGRAVIDRRSEDGESCCDRDRAVKVKGLRGDMALVVIQGKDAVVFPDDALVKDGICRNWSDDVVTLGAGAFDSRAKDLDLLGAKMSTLASVGIECGDRQFR